MKTSRTPPYTCLICKSVNDAAAHADSTPKAGDISICVMCGELTVYNEDLTQRLPTAEELAAFRASRIWDHVVRAQAVILKRVNERPV